jgi:hypothetical protein
MNVTLFAALATAVIDPILIFGLQQAQATPLSRPSPSVPGATGT